MSELVSVRTNIFYTKKKKETKDSPDEFQRNQELIFLVDKPAYKYSNEGEVIRERSLEECRIIVTEKSFEQLLTILEKFKTIQESELK